MSLPDSVLCCVLDFCAVEWLPPLYQWRLDDTHFLAQKLLSKPNWRLYDVAMKAFDVAINMDRDESKFKYLSGSTCAHLDELHKLVKRAGLCDWHELELSALYNCTVFAGHPDRDNCMAPNIKPPISEADRVSGAATHVSCFATKFDPSSPAFSRIVFPCKPVALSAWVTLSDVAERALRRTPAVEYQWEYCQHFLGVLLPHLFCGLALHADPFLELPRVESGRDFDEPLFLIPSPHDWGAYNPLLYVDDWKARWMFWKSDKRRAKHGWPLKAADVAAAKKIVTRLVIEAGWTCCVCKLTTPPREGNCVCSKLKCSCWWDAVKAVVHNPDHAALFRFPEAAWEDLRKAELESSPVMEVVRDGDDVKLMNDIFAQSCPGDDSRMSDSGSEDEWF
jgi:hypothetical protein